MGRYRYLVCGEISEHLNLETVTDTNESGRIVIWEGFVALLDRTNR